MRKGGEREQDRREGGKGGDRGGRGGGIQGDRETSTWSRSNRSCPNLQRQQLRHIPSLPSSQLLDAGIAKRGMPSQCLRGGDWRGKDRTGGERPRSGPPGAGLARPRAAARSGGPLRAGSRGPPRPARKTTPQLAFSISIKRESMCQTHARASVTTSAQSGRQSSSMLSLSWAPSASKEGSASRTAAIQRGQQSHASRAMPMQSKPLRAKNAAARRNARCRHEAVTSAVANRRYESPLRIAVTNGQYELPLQIAVTNRRDAWALTASRA